MSKKLSPIQEAIKFWNERYKEAKSAGAMKTAEAADLFLQYLSAILPKEKEFAKDVWYAASIHTESSGWTQIEEREPPPNFKNYYKQYEP